MSIETYKIVKKKIVKELVPPDLLEGQLAGGYFLSPEEAKAGKANDPPGKPAPKVKPKDPSDE